MKIMDALGFAVANLRKNPVRTLLTILGLSVGVGAVLTVLTLGSAGEEQVEYQIARLGVDKVWITAGTDTRLDAASSRKITAETGFPACAGAYAAGLVRLEDMAAAAQLVGYDEGMGQVYAPQLLEGRLFTGREYSGSAVALADEKLSQALGGDVVGKSVDVGNRRVRIVGIVGGMQVQAAAASNGTIIMPLQTLMDTYAETAVSEITLNVPGGIRADAVGEAAVAALAAGGGEFHADSLQEEIDAARSVVRIFVMVLACVAAVCMLTGGIGVMNILLVSVRERRREIGLIKAIGGTSRQVAALFLVESVCYALLGGALGIVLAVAMVHAFGSWIGLKAALRASVAAPAVAAAALLGVVFGVVPALRAAAMVPVDALKND